MGAEILKKLQPEQAAWAKRNFGDRISALQGLLGVVEEVGELAHAVLKKWQGIRGTPEEHDEAIKDACADVVIFMLDYCNMEGFELYDALSLHHATMQADVVGGPHAELQRVVIALGQLNLADLTNQAQPKHAGKVIAELQRFCDASQLDLWALVEITWLHVKQRDWVKYPKTGFPPQAEAAGKPVTAEQILRDGVEILAARGAQYNGEGGRERHMAQIVAAFEAMTGKKLTPLDGWMFMIALKAVRAGAGGGLDTFADLANYGALAGEEKARTP
jgi:NTP pyrophosphatase (non-canonical NTP hydrolase)